VQDLGLYTVFRISFVEKRVRIRPKLDKMSTLLIYNFIMLLYKYIIIHSCSICDCYFFYDFGCFLLGWIRISFIETGPEV